MNRKQRYAKYDWFIEKTQTILSHYECPESCGASCCKSHYVSFSRNEYEKILKSVDQESADIIKTKSVKPVLPGYYKTLPAIPNCPLLISSKCGIYDNRPESCRKFPFTTFPDPENGFVLMLSLCPLSVKIISDYTQWYKSVNVCRYEEFKSIYEQFKNIQTHEKELVQFNEYNLDSFIKFLETKQ